MVVLLAHLSSSEGLEKLKKIFLKLQVIGCKAVTDFCLGDMPLGDS